MDKRSNLLGSFITYGEEFQFLLFYFLRFSTLSRMAIIERKGLYDWFQVFKNADCKIFQVGTSQDSIF
jgi:hypothetical protein